MHRMDHRITLLLICAATGITATQAIAASPPARDQQVQIVAEKMCCKGCARKVSGKLYTARGVKEVGIDMTTRTVTVSLPHPSAATLGQLWRAVEQGDGGPTKLVTSEATYSLVPPADVNSGPQAQPSPASMSIVIDNLHCKGCAKKIASRLYVLKGVKKVSVDMSQNTLLVETSSGKSVSPWLVIEAVAKAKERPLAVIGPHGKLTIAWATKRAPKNHQQAQQVNTGGIQR